MAQNENPLFPREPENNSEAQSDLLKDVKKKLEVEESASRVEVPDSRKEDLDFTAVVYGPPPIMLEQNTSPPLPFHHKKNFRLVLLGSLIAICAIASLWLINKKPFVSPQAPSPVQEKRP